MKHFVAGCGQPARVILSGLQKPQTRRKEAVKAVGVGNVEDFTFQDGLVPFVSSLRKQIRRNQHKNCQNQKRRKSLPSISQFLWSFQKKMSTKIVKIKKDGKFVKVCLHSIFLQFRNFFSFQKKKLAQNLSKWSKSKKTKIRESFNFAFFWPSRNFIL